MIEWFTMKPFKGILRALKSRNYRLFFFGQGVSLLGTWMTRVAMGWLVYRLTGSAWLLGVVGFAGQVPAFLVTPFAGVLVDRINLHRLIIFTQVLAAIQSAVLAVLALTGVITVTHIIILSAVQGLIDGFDMPGRQAFMIHMIEDKADLGNAIALNSSIFNSARLIGPSIAGLLIAAVGEGFCFLVDAVSYLGVIAALLAMNVKIHRHDAHRKPLAHGLKEGLEYAFGFIPIRTILFLIALLSLMGMPYAVLMPIFADRVLGGGASTLGFLMASAGCGALFGALHLASRKSVIGLGKAIPQACIVFSLSLMAFAISRELWLSLALLFCAGFGMMVTMAASNTLLQTIVDDDKRGRVMSLYVTAFTGMAPFGSLLAGKFAAGIGVEKTFMAGGIFCGFAAVVFYHYLPYLREKIRPIYLKKGIIKETLASGVQAAAQLTAPPEG